jgi:hypothetical protein
MEEERWYGLFKARKSRKRLELFIVKGWRAEGPSMEVAVDEWSPWTPPKFSLLGVGDFHVHFSFLCTPHFSLHRPQHLHL